MFKHRGVGALNEIKNKLMKGNPRLNPLSISYLVFAIVLFVDTRNVIILGIDLMYSVLLTYELKYDVLSQRVNKE